MTCAINIFALRQLLLLCAIGLIIYPTGIIFAFPSVLNPALFDPNSDIKATSDQASWIAASYGLSGVIGFAIMSPIFDFFGRKVSLLVLDFFILCGCLIFYFAKDVYALVFARLAQGLSAGGTFTVLMTLGECVSPERRGYFVALTKAIFGLGSLTCHSLGFVMTWRQISTFVALASCISIVLVLMCAESPGFYATRGQFEKCAKCFKWYRGDSVKAKKELKELIAAQTEIYDTKQRYKSDSILKETKKILMAKDFRKSVLIVSLATLCLDTCGRYFLLAYLTQIVEELTNDRSFAMYTSVAFDCILIFTLCISCFAVKRFNRRTLLFKLGYCSVFLMFLISLSIILVRKLSFLQNCKWLTPSLILLHTFVISIGLIPVAFALTGEVFSLEQKGVGSFVTGIVYISFYSLVMKITPLMIEGTGVEGTYSIYGVCLLICLVLLQMILPETKDKTLQEIEDEIKGITRKKSENELLQCTSVNT